MATTKVSKTIRSNSVAFVDLTDAKKIDVYITSNCKKSSLGVVISVVYSFNPTLVW